MSQAGLSKDAVIDRLAEVFRAYGYDAASLARLSEATGLGRSSLYHHFPNGKDDMAAAVLRATGEWMAENISTILQGPGTPEQRLRRMAAKLREFYDDGRRSCLTELFTMANVAPQIRAAVSRSLAAQIERLAAVAMEAGVPQAAARRRAEDMLIAIQGSLVVGRALGSTEPLGRVLRELPARMLAPS